MSFVPIFPVYANFPVRVNSQHLYRIWLAKKQGIICVSTKCWGSYDVTNV